jgi:uncharacterized membrane protein YcaP (DUF421 family)
MKRQFTLITRICILFMGKIVTVLQKRFKRGVDYMNNYLMIAIELLLGFFLLFIVLKILGKTQFSQITPIDFISAIVIGELLGNAIYDKEVGITEITFAIVLWGCLIYIIELITQKFKGTRKLLEGEPNIVIHKGAIQYNTLKKTNLDINQLQALVRQQGYFAIQEVEYAILETNGKVSVLPKSEYDTPKMSDLNLPYKPVNLPITLIIDKEIIYDNLEEAGLDEKWLKDQLTMKGISDYKDILYAEWLRNKPLYIIKHENKSG